MATVDFCVDDFLGEASNLAIAREVRRRISWKCMKAADVVPDVLGESEAWCRVGMAEDIRTAFYARNAARLEALLVVLEEMEGGEDD